MHRLHDIGIISCAFFLKLFCSQIQSMNTCITVYFVVKFRNVYAMFMFMLNYLLRIIYEYLSHMTFFKDMQNSWIIESSRFLVNVSDQPQNASCRTQSTLSWPNIGLNFI